MLPKIDEKQITWRNLMETVVSDRLEEDEEPIVEVGYGPSPMSYIIQQDIPLLKAVQQLSRQFPQQHYRREYEGEWPHLTQKDVERLEEIRNMPDDEPTILGVDMASEPFDEAALMEVYRGHIALAFGIPSEYFEEAKKEVPKEIYERQVAYWLHVGLVGMCTPSRNPFTGV